jgi:transcriptional regulator with XRE-family HTH domain
MSARVSSLADVLTKLRRGQRLSYAHIARVGHLSRNTVKQITDGKTRRPSEDTLCKIAVGLAVDPYTGRINQETMVRALRELGEAAGYPDLREHHVQQTLPVLLSTITGNLETAQAWVDLIVATPDLDPEDVRRIAAEVARSSAESE